ncbi:MAG: AI-2E family transporter [Oscillospiraceae bacterium]|nr:AI-2E family transporter [Oscillospiraceae bacterium]
MKVEWKDCLKVAVSAFLLYLAVHYWPAAAAFIKMMFAASAPLFVGAVIAYLVNIPMRGIEAHFFPNSENPAVARVRRPVCMLLAMLLLVGVVALVMVLVVPQFIDCVQLIVALLPDALDTVVDRAAEWHLLGDEMLQKLQTVDWESYVSGMLKVVGSGVGSVVGTVASAVSSVFSGVVTAVMAIIFATYLLLDKDTIARQLKRLMAHYLPAKTTEKLTYVTAVFDDCMHRYVVGQCTEAVILGVLCAVGMMLLRMPYATMVGALIAFTALIPIAGAYIGAGVGAFMIFTVNPMQALIFIIYIVVLQQLEGNLIYPRVVGSSIGLPGIWVLAAVTVGGGVAGIGGMLIGVPIAAAAYRIVQAELRGKTPLSSKQ